jgi:hypothetical protein
VNPDVVRSRIGNLLSAYRSTLQSQLRVLIDHFTLADVGHKVVGVGSVGTRAWILLLEAGAESEAVLLQAKTSWTLGPRRLRRQIGIRQRRGACGRWSAPNAGIERHLPRLVPRATDGQPEPGLLHSAASGLETVCRDRGHDPGGHADIRNVVRLDTGSAHARAGDRIAIAAYLGNSAKFDNAIADFAETYADQNERDHAALAAAVADGRESRHSQGCDHVTPSSRPRLRALRRSAACDYQPTDQDGR